MEHGMVTAGGLPGFAAAMLYFLFGVTVLAVVLYLQKRRGNHAGEH
ncbi:MAG: hypothetical protein HYU66_12295 [Armatimonadetes bacterium]|nr:hypothetical protein [Armatimonadota bacterium]